MKKTGDVVVKQKLLSFLKKNKKKIESSSSLVLFGVSELTQIVFDYIKKNNGKVSYIIDNNPSRQVLTWNGIPVVCPESVNLSVDLFIICGGYYKEKTKQLLSLGVSKKNILVFKTYDSILYIACKNIESYLYVKKLKNNKEYLFFCPYPGTGDALLTGRYINDFIKRKCLSSDYCIVVTGNAFKKILESYFYCKNIIVVTKYESELIKRFINCFGEKKFNTYYLLYWGCRDQNSYRIENHCGISFSDIFKQMVFGKDIHAQEIDMHISTEKKKELLDKYKIIKNKTVVLAPYANSFEQELPLDWWEKLADKLIAKGYAVITNIGNEKETVINGTVGINLEFNELFVLLEEMGCIIGMRSGLFDLMASASCKKIVIYQDFITRERMCFFSLNNMKLCNDAIEFKLENTEQGKEELLNNILSLL